MISQNLEMEKEELSTKHSDFSIDHILTKAGTSSCRNVEHDDTADGISLQNAMNKFSWLQCTRYCPPKVPRIHRRDGPQKRQLGRHPRIPFTSHQLSILEHHFKQSPYLSSEEVVKLSKELQLADIRVKIWFQNRRARERREKIVTFPDNRNNEELIRFPHSPPNKTASSPLDFSSNSSLAETVTSFSSQNKNNLFNGSNSSSHTFIPILFPFVSLNNSVISKEERR